MVPLSNAIMNKIGKENFKYAVTRSPEVDRIKMGFKTTWENEEWIISTYADEKFYDIFLKWFYESDIVLFSDRTLFKMAKERTENNKLTFYFSERWWKPPIGKLRLIHPKFLQLAFTLRNLSKNVNFHYLAQGGYAAKDIKYIGRFENRIWNWGYFTDITEHSLTTRPIVNKEKFKINILWCGRLLRLKRVDVLIKAFSITIKKHSHCHLTIIGDGNTKEKLQKLAGRLLPDWSYHFVQNQPIQIIREAMNCSDIFVFPSNGSEGWGAVLNEAMAEGCVVLSSIESGGGKALISDMKNGILFNSGNYYQLSEKLSMLVNDLELMLKLKKQGKETLNTLWSPEIAANRFLQVCSTIISKTEIPYYESGPMKCYSNTK